MYNPTMRLLSILELLQSRGQVSAQALARTLEVEERSIRRYIMMLRDMGIPIESERGRYGGYALRPGFRLPPMMFNHDEIVAIMAGLMLMDELGAVSETAMDSAASKIERVLSDELRQQAQALRQFLRLDGGSPAYPVSSRWLLKLNLAALNKQCLSIQYVSSQGEVSQRVISPYGVVLHGQKWYLPAYCHLREAYRVFRLDRVQRADESEFPYQTADIDPKDLVFDTLAQIPGVYTFEVLFHAPLATVSEYISASTALLTEENGETRMHCYSDDPYWLARYLMRIELPFTIHQTDTLRDALRVIAERVLASI